jgi:hypothetical protein
MTRNDHLPPILADILNKATPAIPESHPILVREACPVCSTWDARAKSQCAPCSYCGGRGYILTEGTV